MVAIHLAYTGLVNPPEARTLTLQQCFAGLQRKVRHGEEFVPAIATTDVVEDTTDTTTQTPIVIREVVFKEGFGPAWAWTDEAKAQGKAGRVREKCILSPLAGSGGCKAIFLQPDGSRIENIIGEGARGELYMTYAFEWFMPDMDAGDTEKIDSTRANFMETAKMAVENSIVSIREMVEDGRIAS